MNAQENKVAKQVVSIEGIEIAIPVGCLQEPSTLVKSIMSRHEDPRGWKFPIKPFVTSDEALAREYADCLDFYVGGHEIIETWTTVGTQYVVASKGYYHYVGA